MGSELEAKINRQIIAFAESCYQRQELTKYYRSKEIAINKSTGAISAELGNIQQRKVNGVTKWHCPSCKRAFEDLRQHLRQDHPEVLSSKDDAGFLQILPMDFCGGAMGWVLENYLRHGKLRIADICAWLEWKNPKYVTSFKEEELPWLLKRGTAQVKKHDQGDYLVAVKKRKLI
jgi:hypothetical protein